ncbi:zinc finger protein 177-like [Musca vetustissima]|uniref:zinc finger protein 177-like n=1 Tax=Musca vetustissima TaxID=27455 RepID=UPI002AB76C01|nr:zinc finger protein 177-like [Musca vetustissima]
MAFDFCFDKKLFLHTTCQKQKTNSSCSNNIEDSGGGDSENCDGAAAAANDVYYEPNDDIKDIFEDFLIWKLNINAMDGMPQQICEECFQRFKQVHSFREECLDSQKILQSYFLDYEVLDAGKLTPKSEIPSVDNEIAPDSVLNNKDVDRSVNCKYNGNDVAGSPFSSPRLRLSPRLVEMAGCLDTSSSIGTPPPLFEEIKTEPIDMETMEVIKPESEIIQEPHQIDYKIRSHPNSSDEEESSTPTSDEEQSDDSMSSDDEDESLQSYKMKQKKPKTFNPRLTCKICHQACASRQQLKTHIMRFHPQEKPFECDICTSTFKSTFMLAQHKLKHNRPDSTQCEECGKYFRSQLHLQRHVKNFHLKSTYTCHICNQQFENYTQMRFQYHVRQHGEKRFSCSFCTKAFHQKIHLINHERTHTKEQPFRCQLCGKAYRQQTACQEHMLTHQDPTPFKCTHCSKAFSQRSTLRMHMQRIHGLEKATKTSDANLLMNHNFF